MLSQDLSYYFAVAFNSSAHSKREREKEGINFVCLFVCLHFFMKGKLKGKKEIALGETRLSQDALPLT
jgi:hypothetical protein